MITHEVYEPPVIKDLSDTQQGTSKRTLSLAGEWVALTVGEVEQTAMAMALSPAKGSVEALNLTGITRLDTTGALVINALAASCRAQGGAAALLHSTNPHHTLLLNQTDLPELYRTERRKASPLSLRLFSQNRRKISFPLVRFINQIGHDTLAEYHLGSKLLAFLGHYLTSMAAAVISPRSIPMTPLVYHMQQTGVAAVPIVALLSFLIGVVIAYMGAEQLARFGAQIFVINLVEITNLREMGVLLTSIIVAGRSGSSFTAQIGSMVANEEVAAMQTMGLCPMNRLVLPRVTALVLMLPALVFLADIMSLLGGGVAVWLTMGLSPSAYAARLQDVAQASNFWVGMVKAPFFAIVIGIVGCFQGFQVTGSAESVGQLTTQAVVEAIFLVIVLDALFAMFFTALGV